MDEQAEARLPPPSHALIAIISAFVVIRASIQASIFCNAICRHAEQDRNERRVANAY
jgi:hypothetical protein